MESGEGPFIGRLHEPSRISGHLGLSSVVPTGTERKMRVFDVRSDSPSDPRACSQERARVVRRRHVLAITPSLLN
jgi:hypothetical protein